MPEWSSFVADRAAATGVSAFGSIDIPFPDGIVAQLSRVASQLDVTAATVLLAIVAEVVRRYCGDVVVVQITLRALHAAASDAAEAGSQRVVGVAADLTDDPSLRALSERIHRFAMAERGPVDDDSPDAAPIVLDVVTDERDATENTAPGRGAPAATDLCCTLYACNSTVRGHIVFDAQRFELGTMRAFASAVALLAECAGDAPEVALSQHMLLDHATRSMVLNEWNATTVVRRPDARMHRLFERQVEATPNATAVDFAGHTLTFQELNARANQLARVLVLRGVGDGVLVAVSMERSLELLVALLAVLKAGGAFVPCDPDLPPERLAYILGDTRAPFVLAQTHLCDRLQATATMTDTMLVPVTPAGDSVRGPSTNLTDRCGSASLAYVIYTSGSTGRPKGVRIAHRALCNHAMWFAEAIGLQPNDRMLQYASISFDASIAELFAPLAAGAPVVFAPPHAHRDLLGIGELLRAHRVTVLQMVPSALRAALAGGAFAEPTPLRYVVSGGEALDHALVAKVRDVLPDIRLGNFYGPSEACVDSTMIEIDASFLRRRVIPIGRPVANVRCHVLDRHLQPVPIGAPGELFIGGLGLADGYHGQPNLTAKRFVADPFRVSDRLYRSGDLARYHADGTIEYLGRVDTQVKLRGYRIELFEIEAALLNYPGIREAAVSVRADDVGEQNLIAYLVCDATSTPPPVQTIMARLRQRLPSYAVPSTYEFLEALPLTTSGKLDRRALAARPLPQLRPIEDLDRPVLADPFEQRLRAIWEHALGVRPVGVDDDFFALGGHSLKAIRLLNDVEREFGLDMRAGVLFEASTIRQFAARLRDRRPRSASTTIPVQSEGNALPLFVVPGGGGELFVFEALAKELGKDQPLYVMDLYAFGDPRETGERDFTLTIADVASRMIRDLRVVQPHGPYRLAGYSLGGNIALEIAQQLRRGGAVVSLVLLLDCDGPGYPHLQPFWPRTITHLRHASSLGVGDAALYLRDRLRELSRRVRGAPPPAHTLFDKELELAPIPPHIVERMERALQPLVHAWDVYVPTRYDGHVTLVRATTRQRMIGVVDLDPVLGWSGLLTDLRCDSIACNHFDILRAPQAPRLAAIVSAALNASLRP